MALSPGNTCCATNLSVVCDRSPSSVGQPTPSRAALMLTSTTAFSFSYFLYFPPLAHSDCRLNSFVYGQSSVRHIADAHTSVATEALGVRRRFGVFFGGSIAAIFRNNLFRKHGNSPLLLWKRPFTLYTNQPALF